MKIKSYQEFLKQQLREDPQLVSAYLEDAIKTNQTKILKIAVLNVIEALKEK